MIFVRNAGGDEVAVAISLVVTKVLGGNPARYTRASTP
jgi:hypothetical protein